MGWIYCINDKKTGMSYIGQTVNSIDERFKKHKKAKVNYRFHNALRKRPDDFIIDWAGEVPNEQLNSWELHYIWLCNTLTPNGYNQTMGGDGSIGFKHTEETRQKLRILNLGKKLSVETREKLSKAGKGKKRSAETCKKISEAQKNRLPTTIETKLKILKIRQSDEYRKNMSLSIKKHWELRRIKQQIKESTING